MIGKQQQLDLATNKQSYYDLLQYMTSITVCENIVQTNHRFIDAHHPVLVFFFFLRELNLAGELLETA